ncbi:MAG: bifunctional 5,10-methylenetetrahydrofolate dehydrogenase/5,10-methenyltetrahydrofolate cyclohydrolase [Planctomycetes bacterium]|nr:bifunctional 5,10-methylenetetrahydrofolate dehydrogenase/5,10-methenyltetrahydrofolate cyclohydrolase [Planctomycetota bacterium]
MPAKVIQGTTLSARIREHSEARVRKLADAGVAVRLDAIVVGAPESGVLYARSQEKRCKRIGIDYRLHTLPEDATNQDVQNLIDGLNRDPDVTGILLNLPLPDHLDASASQYAIDPYKDVEGVSPSNIGLMFYGTPVIAPCTALAVMTILKEANVDVRGMDVVVVGQGNIVGKPIALALIADEASVVSCNEYTRELADKTRKADILIAAAGVAEMITADHVKEGAIVIDVGINTIAEDVEAGTPSRVVGDVKFDEVAAKASMITPVPGGVGPVTVAVLLQSAIDAANKQLGTRRFR